MKRIKYRDGKGVLRMALIRDEDNPDYPEIGIQLEPPPIEKAIIAVLPEIREHLIETGLFDYQDLFRDEKLLIPVVNIIRRAIVTAYKLKELEEHGKQL